MGCVSGRFKHTSSNILDLSFSACYRIPTVWPTLEGLEQEAPLKPSKTRANRSLSWVACLFLSYPTGRVLPRLGNDAGSGRCNRVVVLNRAAGHTDCANDLSTAVFEWQAAGEGNQAIVGMLDVKQRPARL